MQDNFQSLKDNRHLDWNNSFCAQHNRFNKAYTKMSLRNLIQYQWRYADIDIASIHMHELCYNHALNNIERIFCHEKEIK